MQGRPFMFQGPTETPDRDGLFQLMAGFQPACILGAAAELDLFDILCDRAMTAEETAAEMDLDARGVRILLDALASLYVLEKDERRRYRVPSPLRPMLCDDSHETVLPAILHWMNCLRSWSRLAHAIKDGRPGERTPSIRGAEADRAAFVAAMHSISGVYADGLMRDLAEKGVFDGATRMLDVGGASGTWTIAFLRHADDARAVIFDLPDAIEQARLRIMGNVHAERIELVGGDFYRDALPSKVNFAWVSAIIHQHAREDTRTLLGKVFDALTPGGKVAIRDVVMDASRTAPQAGALFAVNMLANTPTGDVYTFDETAEDLQAAGFVEPTLVLESPGMDGVIVARKP